MLKNATSGKKLLTGYDRDYRFFSDMVYDSPRFRFEANQLFPALDRDYPESFFILNRRDVEAWLASRKRKYFHRFGMSFVELEMSVSGLNSEEQVLEKWRNDFFTHEARARSFFRGSHRYLELEITQPGLVTSLSQFLSFDFAEQYWRRITTN